MSASDAAVDSNACKMPSGLFIVPVVLLGLLLAVAVPFIVRTIPEFQKPSPLFGETIISSLKFAIISPFVVGIGLWFALRGALTYGKLRVTRFIGAMGCLVGMLFLGGWALVGFWTDCLGAHPSILAGMWLLVLPFAEVVGSVVGFLFFWTVAVVFIGPDRYVYLFRVPNDGQPDSFCKNHNPSSQ